MWFAALIVVVVIAFCLVWDDDEASGAMVLVYSLLVIVLAGSALPGKVDNGVVSSVSYTLVSRYNADGAVILELEPSTPFAMFGNWHYKIRCSDLRNGCPAVWPKRFKMMPDKEYQADEKLIIVDLSGEK